MSPPILNENKKVSIIRALIGKRMSRSGFDGMTVSNELNQLTEPQLMSTPEAMVVTIIETALVLQNRGLLIAQIVEAIERHRAQLGTNENEMKMIKTIASGSVDRAHTAIPYYCLYRMKIEFPGLMTDEQMLVVYNDAESAVVKACQ